MATKKKAKAPAALNVPQTKEEAAARVADMGVLLREFERLRADMNDSIAEITRVAQPMLEELTQKIEAHRAGVQVWCEANRDALTNGGKTKTANLVTGEVAWRIDPPSVRVTNAEVVITTLGQLQLDHYVRTMREVNKEAILAAFNTARVTSEEQAQKDVALGKLLGDVEALQGLSGITIKAGVEKFVVTPFEVEASPTAS